MSGSGTILGRSGLAKQHDQRRQDEQGQGDIGELGCPHVNEKGGPHQEQGAKTTLDSAPEEGEGGQQEAEEEEGEEKGPSPPGDECSSPPV